MSPSSRTRHAEVVAWLLTAVAVVSALAVLPTTLRQLERLHDRYEPLDRAAAERVIARDWVADPPVWDFYRANVHAGDRYALVTPEGGRRGGATQGVVTRTFASFWLLPAVQVLRREQAEVVVFDGVRPDRAASCAPGRLDACVARTRP